jgi:hypothetical protein
MQNKPISSRFVNKDGIPEIVPPPLIGVISRLHQNPPEGHTAGVFGVIAFHEKAGRSQVDSFLFSLDKVFSPAE